MLSLISIWHFVVICRICIRLIPRIFIHLCTMLLDVQCSLYHIHKSDKSRSTLTGLLQCTYIFSRIVALYSLVLYNFTFC